MRWCCKHPGAHPDLHEPSPAGAVFLFVLCTWLDQACARFGLGPARGFLCLFRGLSGGLRPLNLFFTCSLGSPEQKTCLDQASASLLGLARGFLCLLRSGLAWRPLCLEPIGPTCQDKTGARFGFGSGSRPPVFFRWSLGWVPNPEQMNLSRPGRCKGWGLARNLYQPALVYWSLSNWQRQVLGVWPGLLGGLLGESLGGWEALKALKVFGRPWAFVV